MSRAMSSTRSSTIAAALVRIAPRWAIGVSAQPWNACAAASTAASTSSAPDAGNSPIGSEGWFGLRFSYVRPVRLSLHSPPIRFANAGLAGATISSGLDMRLAPQLVESGFELSLLFRRQLLERRSDGGAGKARDQVQEVLDRRVAGESLRQFADRGQEPLALFHGLAGSDAVQLLGQQVAEERDRAGR